MSELETLLSGGTKREKNTAPGGHYEQRPSRDLFSPSDGTPKFFISVFKVALILFIIGCVVRGAMIGFAMTAFEGLIVQLFAGSLGAALGLFGGILGAGFGFVLLDIHRLLKKQAGEHS